MKRSHLRKGSVGAAALVLLLGLWTLVSSGTLSEDIPQPSAVKGTSSSAATNQLPPTALGPLPYDMASNASLKASGKKVFAHYFPPYPLSFDNKAANGDYYANGYLNPNGENGKHAAYGGLLRTRPLPLPINPSSDWRLQNMKTEVARATAAGLDGFTVDILTISGSNWDRSNLLLQAAAETDGSFKITPMPDGISLAAVDPVAVADAMAGWAKGPYGNSLFKLPDGRLAISPYAPERNGLAYWQTFLNRMQSHGIAVAFVPCFLDYGNNKASWESISYGYSHWGNRSPASNQNIAANINDAHARGKIWMQPVSAQDFRPKSGVYDEANNSENLRTTWLGAINGGADWVQIPTWNDYSEGTELSPSSGTGWSVLDINGYYLQRFKSGAYPQIKRDVLYVSHRQQAVGATITGPQTKYMVKRSNGSPARDGVEVLSFLTSPANVAITVGGSTQTYSAAAGVFSKVVPLQSGTVSATINYANGSKRTVTSPFPVTATREIQDMGYRFVTSGRDGNDTAAPAPAPAPAPSGKVDLVVTDVSWAPASPKVGDELTFSAVIKNQGTAATPSGTIHGVAFLIDNKTVNWSDTYKTAIPVGGTVRVTANYGPAKSATWKTTEVGQKTVVAFVDDINRIAGEADETNNKLSKQITVSSAAIPDITVPGGSTAAPDGGAVVTSPSDAANQGGNASAPTVTIPSGAVVVVTPTTAIPKSIAVSGGSKIVIPKRSDTGSRLKVTLNNKQLDSNVVDHSDDTTSIDTSKLLNGEYTLTITDTGTGKQTNQKIIVNNGPLQNVANFAREQPVITASLTAVVLGAVTVLFIKFHISRLLRRRWLPAVMHATHLDQLGHHDDTPQTDVSAHPVMLHEPGSTILPEDSSDKPA